MIFLPASSTLLPAKRITGIKHMRFGLLTALFITGCALSGAAGAASVYVKALGFDNAEVMIDGGAARPLWVGETSPEGVLLRSVADDTAVFEIAGKLWRLKPGQSTFSQTTLRANAQGMFLLTAQVNGSPLPALIDTGATAVSMNSEDAYRLGINYLAGQRVVARTASGPAAAYLVTFASVQVGDIVLSNVPGSVIDVGKRELPLVLIGMSFLRNVDMQRSGDSMVLQRRDH
jgi:aspartyl protease family protein